MSWQATIGHKAHSNPVGLKPENRQSGNGAAKQEALGRLLHLFILQYHDHQFYGVQSANSI